MNQKYLSEIKAKYNEAFSCGDSDRMWDSLSDIPALIAEVERLNRELSRIRSNAADDKKMLEKDSAAKDQQIATLKKALEAACEDAADEQCPHEFDLYTCGKCAGCPHGGEVHTDAARDAKCWHDYYIQKVQEQEEKK